MKYAILIIVSFLCIGVRAQTQVTQNKQQAFVIPAEIMLPVIASQPDSPLKFEGVRLIKYVTRSGDADLFELRNTSNKPIRDYMIAAYTSYGGMWTKGRPRKEISKAILPGDLAVLNDDEEVEIVPVTDEIREKFKLRNREMAGIEVFMVVRVEFTDGTVFTDEKASKALEAYFHKLSEFHSKG